MEQAIWISIGVISLIIGLGILINLVAENREDIKLQKSQASVEILKNQCNFVCDSAPDTSLSVDVELPSGVVLSSNFSQGNKICALFKDQYKCSFCNCPIVPYVLNLGSAKKIFITHKYECYFERLENAVKMECQG